MLAAAESISVKKAPPLAICVRCGCKTRRSNSNGEPLCRACSLRGRTCMRCAKPLPRATKTLEDGAVCGSCVTYYKEPKPCPICGQLSLRLSRNATKGFSEQPVCEYCQRKGNIICAGCGKHRHPAGTRADGKPICKSCMERARPAARKANHTARSCAMPATGASVLTNASRTRWRYLPMSGPVTHSSSSITN